MRTCRNKLELLKHYIENNEVVYQFCGGLIEVSNNIEKENKETLLNYFYGAYRVEVYNRNDLFVRDNWTDLTDWSRDDDALLLLENIGVLICIPKNKAIESNLVEC